MAESSGIKAGQAYLNLSVNDKFTAVVERAEKRLKAFGSNVTDIGKKMGAVGASIVTTGLVASLAFAKMGSDIHDASIRTGIGAEKLQGLKYAAEQSGASLEDVEAGVKKMSKAVSEAAAGNEAAKDTFKKLGLSASDLKGKTPDEQMKIFADRISKVSDANDRAAITQEIFGKSGLKLAEILSIGSAGIDKMQKHLEDLGAVMSKEDVEAADKFGDTLDDLQTQFNAVIFTVGAAVAEALQPFADAIIPIMRAVIDWGKANKGLVISIFGFGAALAGIGAALIATGVTISILGTAVGGLVSVFGAMGTVLAALASPVGLVTAALAGLAAYLLYTSGVGGKALAWLGEKFNALKDIGGEAMSGIRDALAAGDLVLAAKILWTGLQLAWLTGTKELQQTWIAFKAWFTKIAIEAFYGALDAWAIVTSALEAGFVKITHTFSDLWWDAVYEATKAFDFLERRERDHEKARIKRDRDSGKISQAEANKQLANVDAQANQVLQARNKRDEQDKAERESKLQARLAQITSERDKKLTENVDAEQALKGGASANAQKELQDLEQKRKDLQDQLNAARAEAAEKKRLGPNGSGLDAGKAPEDNFDGTLAKVKASAPKLAGIFNVSALQSLQGGANSALERTAKATEQTEKNTRVRPKNLFT